MITNSIQIPGVTPAVINAIPDEQFWARVATLQPADQVNAVTARLNIEIARRVREVAQFEAKVAQVRARIADAEAFSATHLGIPEYVLKDAAARGI